MPTLSPEDDPLQWWKVEARLPILATLAQKYLYVAPVCPLNVYLARQVVILLVIYKLIYLLLM